ncbi:EthD family reductase [Paenibacillus sp. PR3]|uniref:EthD family reductase n=1 Tax=Paenibacillus terricola TaxID=2763503 RepID=A0ABR8MST2_9BACL|nr:EthD family reductase [Paenibacillus terricola]MBD3919029.1 EthD family reductase [Paenibacillus terricola]
MIVLTFCYKREIPFDETYYFNSHLPLLSKKTVLEMGATKYEVKKVLSSAHGAPAPYSFIFNLYFESQAALDAFIRDPRIKALQDDVSNYYIGEQDIYIEEVVASFTASHTKKRHTE